MALFRRYFPHLYLALIYKILKYFNKEFKLYLIIFLVFLFDLIHSLTQHHGQPNNDINNPVSASDMQLKIDQEISNLCLKKPVLHIALVDIYQVFISYTMLFGISHTDFYLFHTSLFVVSNADPFIEECWILV